MVCDPAAELVLLATNRPGDCDATCSTVDACPIVDLTVEGRLPDLLAARAIPTGVRSQGVHDRALAAYHAWQVALAESVDAAGRRPQDELAIEGGLSAFWLLPSMVRHFYFSRLPQLIVQVTWLLDAEESHPAIVALRRSRRVTVAAPSRAAALLLAEAAALRGGPSADRLEEATRRPRPRRAIEGRASAAMAALRALVHSLRPQRRTDARPVDVALVTRAGDWERDEAGKWRNRYLGDVPRRLADAGLSWSWVPLASVPSETRVLREAIGDEPAPWSSLQLPPRRVAGLLRAVGRASARGRRMASSLVEDPRARLRGLSLGGWLAREIQREMPSLALHAGLIRAQHAAAVAAIRPSVVLLKDEFFPFGQAACSVRRRGMQVWSFQHGTIPREHWIYRHPASFVAHAGVERQPLNALSIPDRILTYGWHEVELLASGGGHRRETLVPIGSLRHDALFEAVAAAGSDALEKARRRKGLPEDRRVVLLCTQWSGEIARWIEMLAAALRCVESDAHVLVRPHWNSTWRDIVPAAIARSGLRDASIDTGDLVDSLFACDVVISATSTTVLEAAVVGRRSACILDAGEFERMDYVASGLSEEAPDVPRLAAALRRIFAEGRSPAWEGLRRRYLAEHLRNVQEPATRRLLALLREHVGES